MAFAKLGADAGKTARGERPMWLAPGLLAEPALVPEEGGEPWLSPTSRSLNVRPVPDTSHAS